jgi:hypothetical protein
MALSQNNNLQNELTIEKVFLPQMMKLESDIYLQNNEKKKNGCVRVTKTPWNYSARLKGDFNVKGLITVLQLF